MDKTTTRGALAAALTAALAASPVQADANPFGLTDLAGGYMLAAAASTHPHQDRDASKEDTEGKCGEGKCGEGRCGGHAEDTDDDKTDAEGRCGEGRCGAA